MAGRKPLHNPEDEMAQVERDGKNENKEILRKAKLVSAQSTVLNRDADLFGMLIDFATGNAAALGYEGQRTRFLKDGGVILEDWISPEMRLHALKEAVKYVYPQLKAVAIQELQHDQQIKNALEPVSRAQLIQAIKNDPFLDLDEPDNV